MQGTAYVNSGGIGSRCDCKACKCAYVGQCSQLPCTCCMKLNTAMIGNANARYHK